MKTNGNADIKTACGAQQLRNYGVFELYQLHNIVCISIMLYTLRACLYGGKLPGKAR